MAYSPSSHVHWRRTEDGIVLLDLNRGRYLGLSELDVQAIAPFVPEWRAEYEHGPSANESVAANAACIIDSLVRSGILIETDSPISARAAHIPVATEALGFDEAFHAPSYTVKHIAVLALAYMRTQARLRTQPLHAVVRKIRDRKERRTRSDNADPLAMRNLSQIYLYLRPLIFAAKDRCLLDSLVLVEFLSSHDIYPEWVIGVKTQPFGAHSWVQHDALVLNDTPEKISRFRPILWV
ncbi:MAG TPA: lasso peptide biosynthesis B2 protein [Steroidobacter sp.]|jgi:hypothetical protein|nr:lasso peptide biosynthesis B2 protein [Steroidobacteraceae bacterium]HLS80132.1 lasso peptide biosynthesis B2 protein [Steroidobacter sp.]